MNTIIKEIENERNRQVSKLGWTPEHDAQDHSDGALAKAASIYADPSPRMLNGPEINKPDGWPNDWDYKPKSRRENLMRAGALIVAEVERLDRASQLNESQGSDGNVFKRSDSLGSKSPKEIADYLDGIGVHQGSIAPTEVSDECVSLTRDEVTKIHGALTLGQVYADNAHSEMGRIDSDLIGGGLEILLKKI